MSGLKRKYQSGAAKRKKKEETLQSAIKNTASISSLFPRGTRDNVTMKMRTKFQT